MGGEVKYYDNLPEAVKNADDGSTVYLLREIRSLSSVSVSGKSITVKGVSTVTVIPSASPVFKLTGGASLTLENISFKNCNGKNLITVGQGEYSSRKPYTVALKNTELFFENASGAIYAYNSSNLTVNITNCKFGNTTDGNAILNFGGSQGSNAWVDSCVLNLTDIQFEVNGVCDILNANLDKSRITVNESFTSTENAKLAGFILNADGEPISVGGSYTRSLADYFNSLSGTKKSITSAYKTCYPADTFISENLTSIGIPTATGKYTQAGHEYHGAWQIAMILSGTTSQSGVAVPNVKPNPFSSSLRVNYVFVGVVDSKADSWVREIDADEYSITVENDGDVYIIAQNDKMLSVALKAFLKLLKSPSPSLPVGNHIFTAIPNLTFDFPRPDGLKLVASQYVNDDSLQYLYYANNGTLDSSAFDSYISMLKSNGFVEVWSNTVEENKFATLKSLSAGFSVYVAYNGFKYADKMYGHINDSYRTEFNECIRIVTTPLLTNTLPDDNISNPSPSYTEITNTSFVTAVGVSHPGMSYIVALKDGRFIVVDAGQGHSGEALWTALKASYKKVYGKEWQAGEKIKIAAWYVTHAHSDHFYEFYYMSSKYAEHIELEYLVANGIDEYTISLYEGGQTAAFSSQRQNIDFLKELYDCKYIKAHSGQKLYFANVELEVLMTVEDHLPIKVTNSNDTNTVIRFNFREGEKTSSLLFLGDSQVNAGRYLCASYGGYLKSDVVQLAHHANVGTEAEVYELTAAKGVFVSNLSTKKASYFDAQTTNYHIRANKKAMSISEYLWFAPAGSANLLEFTENGPSYEGIYNINNANTPISYDNESYFKNAAPHSITEYQGKSATESESGWMNYYKCSCGYYYENEECSKLITVDIEEWKLGDGKIIFEEESEQPQDPIPTPKPTPENPDNSNENEREEPSNEDDKENDDSIKDGESSNEDFTDDNTDNVNGGDKESESNSSESKSDDTESKLDDTESDASPKKKKGCKASAHAPILTAVCIVGALTLRKRRKKNN